jgi:Transposase
MYVGWDWASQRHDVTVIDDTGQLVDRWTLAHSEAGIRQAMTRLAGHGRPDDLPVAIEATSGIVVDRLLAAGYPVVPIHPTASTPPDPAGERPRPSPTPVTASSWPTTCAPMATGCAACNPPMLPPVTCRPSRACARTTWRPRPLPPTSSAPC